MKFVALEQGETLATLARRLYGAKTKAARAEAENALLRANPHLRDPANLKRGVLVAVPDEAAAASAGATGVGNIAAQLLQAAREIVGDLNSVISPGLDQQEQEAKATLEVLKSANLKRVAEKIPELKERLPEAGKRVEEQLGGISSLRGRQKEALAEFDNDIAELRRSFES